MTSRKPLWMSLIILALAGLLAWYFFFAPQGKTAHPFSFGLDLVGGTELVYRADTSKVTDRVGAMDSLKEVIERRVNIFGVSEPLVQTEHAGFISGSHDDRLIVELPGVTDIEEAKAIIGKTPILEFHLARPGLEDLVKAKPEATLKDLFAPTALTGRYLSRARVEFNQTTGAPIVSLEFNAEGRALFAEITKA